MKKHDMTAFKGKTVKEVSYTFGKIFMIFDDHSQITFKDIDNELNFDIVLKSGKCIKCGAKSEMKINLKDNSWQRDTFCITCSSNKCNNKTNNYIDYCDAYEEWENKN